MRTDAQILRMWARRRHGKSLTPRDMQRVESWLAKLEEQNAVIVYVPDTEEGFFWVSRDTTENLRLRGWTWVDPRA